MTYRNATREGATRRKPLTEDQYNEMRVAYVNGKTDLQISEIVGCASKTVARWRRRNHLERNDR